LVNTYCAPHDSSRHVDERPGVTATALPHKSRCTPPVPRLVEERLFGDDQAGHHVEDKGDDVAKD
jgi:hypothetical protein